MKPHEDSFLPLSSTSFRSPANQAFTQAVQAIEGIRHSVSLQLQGMAQWATDSECRDCLHSVAAAVEEPLGSISKLAITGHIQPFCQIALSEDAGPVLTELRPVRLGVYPLAANPMHWGHILVGLTAMASMRLDKVVFLVAGADCRKPSMVTPEARHRLAKSVIEEFHPLFAYCPLALGTDLDGETNFARLLRLNSHQPMEVHYIAGGDHYRRITPEGEPDTVQKLERVFEEQRTTGKGRHSISAVFIDREDKAREEGKKVETFLDIHVLPAIPFSFSSTAARTALCKDSFCVDLVSLPYSCLLEIRTSGLYVGEGECVEEVESPL